MELWNLSMIKGQILYQEDIKKKTEGQAKSA